METKLGRVLAQLNYETQMLLRAVLDIATGLSPDVRLELEGRELVFRATESGRGFLRVVAQDNRLRLSFPRGDQVFDPRGRAVGPPGLQKGLLVHDRSDLDEYLRRMIRHAHSLDVI